MLGLRFTTAFLRRLAALRVRPQGAARAPHMTDAELAGLRAELEACRAVQRSDAAVRARLVNRLEELRAELGEARALLQAHGVPSAGGGDGGAVPDICPGAAGAP